MVARNFVGTARDPGGLTASRPGTIEVTPAGGAPVLMKFGETTVLGRDDFGNSAWLCAQRVDVLPGVPVAINFWVPPTPAVVGQLKYLIYTHNAATNRPGTLLGQVPPFTPVANNWNRKVLPTIPKQTGNVLWIVYQPSSNNLHFRATNSVVPTSFIGGATRAFNLAAPTTFPAWAWQDPGQHWSFYLEMLVDQADIPPPPEPGLITYFVSTAPNWDDPSIIGGLGWYNQHGGRPYSVVKVDNYTLDFEVRQGDPEAIDVGGERSEMSSAFPVAADALMDLEFLYMLKPGAPFVMGQNGLAWLTMDQFHGDVRPSWIGFAENEKIFVNCNPDVPSLPQPEWMSPTPIVRGREYKIRHQVKRAPTTNTGFVRLWIDDVLVADFSNIKVGGVDNYFKFGMYRGWNGEIAQTMAARYRKIIVRT